METHVPPATSVSLPRNVKVLGVASLLNDVASEMIFPLMPQFLIAVLGGNKFHLGIIEGVADSVASVLKLFAGGWSDKAGRRKDFVLFGYGLAALARPAIGLALVPWQVFAARVGDRIGKGIRTSPRDALIADSTAAEIQGRAFGFHRAMDHLGAAIGPLLAAGFLWLWPGKLQLLFLLTIVPGLLVVLLIAMGLRETKATSPPQERLVLTLAPFDKNFRLYLTALVVFALGNSSDAFLLVRASELGVATPLLPILWCVFHVAKSIGNVLGGQAADKFGPRAMILTGWCVYAMVYLAFALATAAWHAWVLFLAYSLFYALTEPAEKKLVTQLVGRDRTGLAFGWFHFALGISALPSSLIFGMLYQQTSALVAFGWGAALAAVAALLLVRVRPRAAVPIS